MWVFAGRFELLDELLYEHQPPDAGGGGGEIMLHVDLGLQVPQLLLAGLRGFAAKLGKPLPVTLVADLLERHARHGTAHAALIAEIQGLLAGNRPAPRPGSQPGSCRSRGPEEQLSDSEIRVLRYLPTHLTGSEIANELFLSANTVSTHTRHLYAKLGVHNRHEAVDRARALGLLAPPARRV